MPIHLRRYHIRKIDGLHKQQNEEIEKARRGNNSSPNVPKSPNFNKK
jgi:hypothetical protein